MTPRIGQAIAAGTGMVVAVAVFAAPAPEKKRIEWAKAQEIRTKATSHAAQQRARLQLDDGTTFDAGGITEDDRGTFYVRMQQVHRGIRVLDAGMSVHLDDKLQPKRTVDAAVPGININVRPSISEREAAQIVQQDAGAVPADTHIDLHLNIWINSGLEHVPDPSKRIVANRPNAEEYQPRIRSTHLVYLAKIWGKGILPWAYLVDAHSGQILKKWHDFQEQGLAADTWVAREGVGRSFYYGTKTIDIGFRNGVYRLVDPTRGYNIVLNMKDSVLFPGFEGDPFESPDADFGDGLDWTYGTSTTGVRAETAAVDVAYGIQLTWDLLNNVFGREGLDGQRSPIKARVHFRKELGEPYGDAMWSGGVAHFGDGANDAANSSTSLFFVPHELGHGFWGAATDYDVGNGESSGLNEGTGDIFSSLVSFYLFDRDAKGNMLPTYRAIDEFTDCGPSPWACRIFDPESYTIKGETGLRYYVDGMGDREVHTQGACYGHMFVMFAHGASSNTQSKLYSQFLPHGMAGIGVHKAARIFYHATTGYFVGGITPSFALMRTAYLFAAADLYGANSLEYKAVQNAFAGINVGQPASDSEVPEVSVGPITVHANEMALRAFVTSEDDSGVSYLSMNVASRIQPKVPGGFFSGWVDLWDLKTGEYEFRAVGTDRAGRQGTGVKKFDFPAVNQLAKNGGFESGDADRTKTGDVSIEVNRPNAFAGQSSAIIKTGTLSQTISIPAGATSASLSFRLRVTKKFSPGQTLQVRLLSAGGQLLQVLNGYSSNYDTDNGFDNDYKRETFDLRSRAGQTVQISFVNAAAGGAEFRIDQVSVVYNARLSATFDVVVDEGEGSIITTAQDFRHFAPGEIDAMYFDFGPGNPVRVDREPWDAVRSTDGITKNTTHRAGVQIRNPFNEVVLERTEDYTVRNVNQLVRNGSFEEGDDGWSQTGNPVFGFNPNLSFLGTRLLFMAGRGVQNTQVVRQRITIPPTANSASLSLRLRIVRTMTGQSTGDSGDHFRVRIRDTTTNLPILQELAHYTGATPTPINIRHKDYGKIVFPMNAYRGRSVILEFESIENGAVPSTFYVDAVSVTYRELGVTQ